MKAPKLWVSTALGLAGATVGAVLGYFTFFWIARQGFYALILPPALMGLGAGLGALRRNLPLAVTCGLTGMLLALFIEWRFAPFVADASLGYFATHLHELRPITLVMVVVGGLISYRLALGWSKRLRPPGPSSGDNGC